MCYSIFNLRSIHKKTLENISKHLQKDTHSSISGANITLKPLGEVVFYH